MSAAAGFLAGESARHPLQTPGRWAWLAGAAVDRTGVTVLVAGLAMVVSATMAPREIVGTSGTYLALALLTAVALRCATTGSATLARAEELVTSTGMLALAATYVLDATPDMVRVAVAGAVFAGVVLVVWPSRFRSAIAVAGDAVKAWWRGTIAAAVASAAALLVALIQTPSALGDPLLLLALLGLSAIAAAIVAPIAMISYPLSTSDTSSALELASGGPVVE